MININPRLNKLEEF